MNNSSTTLSTDSSDAWLWAARLLERWQAHDERVDWLLETLPADLSPGTRARVQALLIGTVRHLGKIDAALDQHVKRPPRPLVWAGLRVAGFELLDSSEAEGQTAKVGHHLVNQIKKVATKKEAAFANAVVRRLAVTLAEPEAPLAVSVDAVELGRCFSHPSWIVERWLEQLGADATRQLLDFNQSTAPVVVRWRGDTSSESPPSWLSPMPDIPGFYTVESGHGPELRGLVSAGAIHIQDAATRLAIDLLAPVPGETILDLCAAPGGKSLAIADRINAGKIVALDLPGRRLPRLRENLDHAPDGVETVVVPGDLRQGGSRALKAASQPTEFEAVLLDVPCSNTGVMRHRVDVKWRLQPDSFRRHALQQLELLIAAADRVAVGGRLVYSTCSIDREENEQVVQAFLKRSQGKFALEDQVLSLPWASGHDGAATFLLRKRADA